MKHYRYLAKGGLALLLLLVLFAPEAQASVTPDDTCSSSPVFQIDRPSGTPGLVSETVNYIRSVVMSSVQALFIGIATNSDFQYAAMGAITLAVCIYAVMFMFGVVPLTLGQALNRLVKIIFVMIMISPISWIFFSDTVFRFFDAGTDELILLFVNTATGVPMPVTITIFGDWLSYTFGVTNPFWMFDNITANVLSPTAIGSLVASFTETGPFGIAMGLLMGSGTIVFLLGVLSAMRIYCVSIIAKGLLFGIAPIMFVMLLFDRTKSMFTGWVNQLVNFSLQPILMFAFLSFYLILIESAYNNMLDGIEICFVPEAATSGGLNEKRTFQFKLEDGTPSSEWSWEGMAECLQDPTAGDCPEFPISVINVLTFLFTAYLGWKMTNIIPSIAIEIAGSSLMLNRVGDATRWGGGGGAGGGSMMGGLFGR